MIAPVSLHRTLRNVARHTHRVDGCVPQVCTGTHEGAGRRGRGAQKLRHSASHAVTSLRDAVLCQNRFRPTSSVGVAKHALGRVLQPLVRLQLARGGTIRRHSEQCMTQEGYEYSKGVSHKVRYSISTLSPTLALHKETSTPPGSDEDPSTICSDHRSSALSCLDVDPTWLSTSSTVRFPVHRGGEGDRSLTHRRLEKSCRKP